MTTTAEASASALVLTDLSAPDYAGPGVGITDTCGLCFRQFDLMYPPGQYPTVHVEGTDTWELICDDCQDPFADVPRFGATEYAEDWA